MNLRWADSAEADAQTPVAEARFWRLRGRVQAVGFRPFVYRLAERHRLAGWVRNLSGEVELLAEGPPDALDAFGRDLLLEAPSLARPEVVEVRRTSFAAIVGFRILESATGADSDVTMPPDLFVCDDCRRELLDPADRRHRYPFINCTQCGPRYTLIRALPYDRSNTTMADFPLCRACADEYADPVSRRFHAEPIACPDCGPELHYVGPESDDASAASDAMAACAAALKRGCVVAVKGVGGYHLICDATDPQAVGLLRRRKQRPHKPLAVMFPDTDGLAMLVLAVSPTATEVALLRHPGRPIVLVGKRDGGPLAPDIAPGFAEIGAMLPYSPVHHLLMHACGRPLVVTSGNPSGEPVLTEGREAGERLRAVADAFLHHNRPIARPADDTVYRVAAGIPRPVRLGRGFAPVEIELPFALNKPTLALGAHLKNTIALGWGRRAVVSPHLADMDRPRSLTLLRDLAGDLQSLYGVRAEQVLSDAHPRYGTTRIAREWGLPLRQVFHHRAHASALSAEAYSTGDMLVFAWDGAGLGEDGTIWGGEALLGGPGRWRRVASIRPFPLLGGEAAAREPWRSALALCLASGAPWPEPSQAANLLAHAFARGLNSPSTSSVGRLFDAAAAFIGLCPIATFDGHAPMLLEAACGGPAEALVMPLAKDDRGIWIADWAPLIAMLRDPAIHVQFRSAAFHHSLAAMLVAQACAVRTEASFSRIGLVGGVFQNRTLVEAVFEQASAAGLVVSLPQMLPCNDAGISLGQLVEAAAVQ